MMAHFKGEMRKIQSCLSCHKHGKMKKSQSFIIIANQKIKYNLSANMMSTILLCDHHTDGSNFIIVHSSWLHDIDIHVEG